MVLVNEDFRMKKSQEDQSSESDTPNNGLQSF